MGIRSLVPECVFDIVIREGIKWTGVVYCIPFQHS